MIMKFSDYKDFKDFYTKNNMTPTQALDFLINEYEKIAK